METKSSGLAIILSFFWTGLGQLYSGRIARGLVMMGAAPVIWMIGWVGGFASLGALVMPRHAGSASVLGVLVACAPFAYWIWGMIDAKRLCETHNRSQSSSRVPAAI